MNRIINGKTYELSIRLFWGSDKTDVTSAKDTINSSTLDDSNVVQLDIISSLAVPFFYGSFVYSDSKSASKLVNLIDMPLVHGILSFGMVNGTDIPGMNQKNEPFEGEYFTENIFITGIESIDSKGDYTLVKFNFASSDILKFTANIKDVSTFDKDNGDKEVEPVNDVIKKIFSNMKLEEKLDIDSFTANVDMNVKYINSSNDNALTALEYLYRKTYDDNFTKTKDCTYVRIRYNHTTHKYEQWRYSDVGTSNAFPEMTNEYEPSIRTNVSVDVNRVNDPNIGHGRFYFSNSGNSMDSLENYESVNFIDYDYKKNEFKKDGYEMLDKLIVDHSNELDDSMVTRASVINDYGDWFKDVDYMQEFTTSNQNGSIYDIITDSIFNSNFYRVESDGSVGRKAGDGIFVQFSDAANSMYETVVGDYIITAIDNRYEASGNDGNPSFRSIMDVHRPYLASDSSKHETV